MSAEAASQFLSLAGPPAERRDRSELAAVVRRHWTNREVIGFAESADPAVRRLALTALAVTGSPHDCTAVVSRLADSDSTVAASAEDALWGIWMRAASQAAVRRLADSIRLMNEGVFELAVENLYALTDDEPAFAEAYHQLGIALQTLGRLDEAEVAYRSAYALNSGHFAACGALGHIAAERLDLSSALAWYHDALRIHPRLDDIRAILPELETAVLRRASA